MKTAKEYSDTAKREVSVDVDALLAAINEISESEIRRSRDDPHHVSVDGRDYHTWCELAEAFEFDIHDFSVTEINRVWSLFISGLVTVSLNSTAYLAEVLRGGQRVFHTVALNDVVVNKGELGRMIEFDLRVDGEFVYTQRSDGMIISTPTGSTAYALSANGPILHPNVDGIALVPMCPHTLTARPITLPDRCRIEIVLLPPHDSRVHFDGQTRYDTRAGDTVQITRSPHNVRLLHPEGYSYFAMLREKLHWSSTPRHS